MNNILRYVPKSLIRNWTYEAKECYLRGCNCNKCFVIKYLSSSNKDKCKMKAVVLQLVKKFGKPTCIEEYKDE